MTTARIAPARALFRILLIVCIAGSLGAAPVTHDLGQGLTYVRASTLPGDLPPSHQVRACVLDLRSAAGDESAAFALAAWLKFHATARRPVFILANGDTAAPLRAMLATDRLPAGALTLGRPSAGFTPDIAVNVDAAAEAQVLSLLADGTPPADLLQENTGKARYDEARMVRELAGSVSPEDPTASDAAAQPATPVDRSLQRAVQVHRGLAALRRFRG